MSDLLKTALSKVERTSVPKVNIAILAYSGGLDSSLAVELLRRKYKAEKIIPITVDVGQGEEEVQLGIDRAKILNIEPIMIDARDEFTEEWMAKAIMANSDYMGYPVSTSMTRQLIAREVAEKAVEVGADALVEGSTGKGNDQYRMHNVFTMFAPGKKVIAPVRDFDFTRAEEEALCREWGVPVEEVISGGDDKTMWCRSIASGAIDLNMEIPDSVWMWYNPPEQAPDKAEIIEIVYEKGIPVELNGKSMLLKELVPTLNEKAGAHGIGMIDIFEEGIMNLKSRELYEAPAAAVIMKTHRDLEQMCLTKEELMLKKQIEQKWGYMVYHGQWFHPLRKALDAFIAETQEMVSGTIKVKMYKGNADITYRDSVTSLFSPEIRSIKSSGFSQPMCADAAKIRGLQYEILAKRDHIAKSQ
ncbi:argininosuccinate synthase [Candidatus Poribacteria bacterium]|nr:argininosuccinate synthase [Candidatus Poribacteria bacterium]